MAEISGLRGVLPALVTPLLPDGEIDPAGTRRLIAHVLDGGVGGVLALGSTGEVASLPLAARRRYLETVVEAVAGRVPVLAGVARDNLADAALEVEAATAAGAAGALVAPPHYYLTDQATVLAFYRHLAAGSPLPLLVYNIPQLTKVRVEPGTLRQLAEEGAIAGVKDSSRDFEYFQMVAAAVRDLPGFRLFTGSDTMLLASLAMGGAGTICGGANVAPGWVVGIDDAFRQGRWEEARKRQHELVALVEMLRVGVFPAAIKSALAAQGVCGPWPAPPVAPLSGEAAIALRERLEFWGLVPAATVA
ncbi:MAG: dihydrodipicolinate synthase family protein [Candidatus Dormibacteraeota bacterium]|nr:dihydrodipicolinate synthase family protein [Candidatus Dormibacteraeota bacterium]